MSHPSPNFWKRYRAWRKRQSRVGRLSIRLTEALLVLFLLNRAFVNARGVTLGFIILLGTILCPLLLVLLKRWISRRVLWKVRNRLIVTYLLMGLAPIVLFGTLTAITAYFLIGQYEASAALLPIQEATAEAAHEADGLVFFLLLHGDAPVNVKGVVTDNKTPSPSSTTDISLALLTKTGWKPVTGVSVWNSTGENPLLKAPAPAWLHPGFEGVVAFDSHLYIVSERSAAQGARSVTALATIPLDHNRLNGMAKPLGRVILSPGLSFGGRQDWRDENASQIKTDEGGSHQALVPSAATDSDSPAHPVRFSAHRQATRASAADSTSNAATPDAFAPPPPPEPPHNDSFDWVRGGAVPAPQHLYDTRVFFSTPFVVIDWSNGQHLPALVNVISRVTVLYAHLFATSLKLGLVIRVILISIAVFFAFLELFALWMALHLGHTITCSVADLYKATAEIDHGNLEHRIVVKRQDQLGALSTSFNRMAASLQDLLAQQREKDRLLNELAIAKEVQENLFPHSPVSLPGLEVHAVCIPARTVSGDYFDFIFGHGSQLCLALGDISGKGISAALLMASLNSAVRAFSLGTGEPDGPPSPAKLLGQLNRHLYQSTQPEKYATLFLACYDTVSRQLTYSNAGHLPPVIISSDGNIQKLECGGTVVGLLEGMEYCEATIELQPGDLLLAFSDGLTEPENDSGEFGEQRLLDCVRERRTLPLPALAAVTLKTLQQWIGDKEQPDDMTIMLARQL